MEIKTAIEDIARLMLELAECKERQKELEKQIQNIINDFCSDKKEQEKIMIVSVRFNKRSKIYDYQLIGENQEIAIGDTVYVSTPHQGIVEVEVVDYNLINKENSAFNYSPACTSKEMLIEYCYE